MRLHRTSMRFSLIVGARHVEAGHVSFQMDQRARIFSTSMLLSIGILLRRFPVAAKTALAMAGTLPDVPASPSPSGNVQDANYKAARTSLPSNNDQTYQIAHRERPFHRRSKLHKVSK